jgi:hypothetical protein
MKALPEMTGAERAAAVVIAGQDVTATGRAALDLAVAEARHRPVIIVDLIGDAPPLRAVVVGDDIHGVSDCFAYGVSFAAATRGTTAGPWVSLIQSGSEPVTDPEMLRSERWDQLIAQARARRGLVIFAARSDTPGLDALSARVNHVIPAGLVLSPSAPSLKAAPVRTRPRVPGRATPRRVANAPVRHDRRLVVAGAAVAAVLVVGLATWLLRRGAPTSSAGSGTAAQQTDTLTSTAQLAVADRSIAGAAPSASDIIPPLADPQDSAAASAFSIRIGTYPTYARALGELRQQVKRGAATVSPLPSPALPTGSSAPAASFAVYVGAARTADPLDSAARAWARGGGFAGGAVTRTPYALRLTDRISIDSARRATIAWRGQGIPAYALNDFGGQAAVYAGAFVSIDQTAPLTASLHAVGLTPSVAYRVGLAP